MTINPIELKGILDNTEMARSGDDSGVLYDVVTGETVPASAIDAAKELQKVVDQQAETISQQETILQQSSFNILKQRKDIQELNARVESLVQDLAEKDARLVGQDEAVRVEQDRADSLGKLLERERSRADGLSDILDRERDEFSQALTHLRDRKNQRIADLETMATSSSQALEEAQRKLGETSDDRVREAENLAVSLEHKLQEADQRIESQRSRIESLSNLFQEANDALDKTRNDFAAFKKDVVREAMKAAEEHGWCDVVKEVLEDELGLDVEPPAWTIEYAVTIKADVYSWRHPESSEFPTLDLEVAAVDEAGDPVKVQVDWIDEDIESFEEKEND